MSLCECFVAARLQVAMVPLSQEPASRCVHLVGLLIIFATTSSKEDDATTVPWMGHSQDNSFLVLQFFLRTVCVVIDEAEPRQALAET